MNDHHTPVLLDEVVATLKPKPDAVYIDGTAGFGGHAAAILEQLGPHGKAFLYDQDPDAVAALRERFAGDERVTITQANFATIPWSTLPPADMILLDIGVSSKQLGDGQRGFSFQNDGPLDMRMNPSIGETAADLVAQLPETELADVLWRYGEERASRRIAKAIVKARHEAPITTTKQLAEIIRTALLGRGGQGKIDPATRSFQALRIAVNHELDVLSTTLPRAAEHLAPGGRLVVLSFHSLEDRIIKHFMRDITTPLCDNITGQPLAVSPFNLVTKRPLTASPEELVTNPRARSAKLRALQAVEKKNPK